MNELLIKYKIYKNKYKYKLDKSIIKNNSI